MNFFRAWRDTRKYELGQRLTDEQINKLNYVVKVSQTIKKVSKAIWAVLVGICTIVAAVFSILAYFKQ